MRPLLILALSLFASLAQADGCPALYQHPLVSLRGQPLDLCSSLAGKVVLVVNTASHCGFTPQFKGLETLYQQYREQGFEILGVPSDDFFQEDRDPGKTAQVCYRNYGVTFTMGSEQHVRGKDAHPLFRALIDESGESPSWNFYKYLVGRDGKVIGVFSSRVKPDDAKLGSAIEKALQAKP